MPIIAPVKIVIVGHGYLGKAIARDFTAAGWEVVPVSLHGADGSLACDVSLESDVACLPDADAIVHCAASGRGGAEAYQNVYVAGCRNLAARYPGLPLLFTSSTSVYAQVDGSEVTEKSPAMPDRETGKLLLDAERIVLENGGTVARLAGLYGSGRSVILKKFLSGEAFIEEDGRRFLNQIHSDDAASAVFHLLAGGHRGIFNVTDSSPLSQLATYQALAEIFSLPLPPSGPRDPHRKRGWTHKRVCNAKLRATGWQPRFPSFTAAARKIAGTL